MTVQKMIGGLSQVNVRTEEILNIAHHEASDDLDFFRIRFELFDSEIT